VTPGASFSQRRLIPPVLLGLGLITALALAGLGGGASYSRILSCAATGGHAGVLPDSRSIGSENRLYSPPDGARVIAAAVDGVSCAVRFNVYARPGGLTNRSEISRPQVLWRSGQTKWYALSLLLGRRHPWPGRGGWMIVTQFFAEDVHHGLSGGSPPVAIEVTSSGHLVLDIRGGRKVAPTAAAPLSAEYDLGTATSGVWHDLLLRVTWSTDAAGRVEAWQRTRGQRFTRTPQVDARGPNVLTVAGDVLPVYAEVGIYRSSARFPQVTYFGGLGAFASRRGADAFLERPAHR